MLRMDAHVNGVIAVVAGGPNTVAEDSAQALEAPETLERLEHALRADYVRRCRR